MIGVTHRGSERGIAIALAIVFAVAACGSDVVDPGPDDQNRAPTFSSSPPTVADHNREWSYVVAASDPDGDPVTLSAAGLPSWITFDGGQNRLSGLAGFNNLGDHAVTLRATDGQAETRQDFTLSVAPGEIDCTQSFGDPIESLYILPYLNGRSQLLQQGNCNTSGGHVNWFAYDLDTAIGDTLVASRGGEVVAVREQFADGTRICGEMQENLVFIRHDDGTIMAYIHLTTNGALVDVGDQVAQGEVIALSGDSGCSAGPHVHVALFAAQRTGFDRQWSLPLNFSNAVGNHDARGALIAGETYQAVGGS
ncbi:MAG: peptidoglycan DD-metalloendopeptidase family protein [Gemmatimonadota bacterium]